MARPARPGPDVARVGGEMATTAATGLLTS